MPTSVNPELEADRVRRYTSPEMLKQIEKRIEHNIRFYAAQPRHVLDRRIEQLRCEWSLERYLQANAASVGFTTALLGLLVHRKWALLTCGALGFFLYHGLRGFDPPIPVLRRMGVRTRGEIDRELYALKAIRGDFRQLPKERPKPQTFPARDVLKAVNA
jgi:hypothetical protein